MASRFPIFRESLQPEKNLDDARAMAEEAPALHIDGLLEDGEALPEASSLEQVMSDPENKDSVAILVAAKTSPVRCVRVNVTLPEDVLAQIDKSAEECGLSRSGFLAQAAKKALEQEKGY